MLPPPRSFVSRSGTVGGYEVRGWRYVGETAWHVKVKPKGGRREKAYLVKDGEFNPQTATPMEAIIVLDLIELWETETESPDSVPLLKARMKRGPPRIVWRSPRAAV
jgi:hypothetical protein